MLMKLGEYEGELESRIQFSEYTTNPVEAMPRPFAPPDARLSADQEILVALFQNSGSQPRWFFSMFWAVCSVEMISQSRRSV
jgi:hypothetical protein